MLQYASAQQVDDHIDVVVQSETTKFLLFRWISGIIEMWRPNMYWWEDVS